MTTLIYDKTWTGFLSAIFYLFEYKPGEVIITTSDRFQPDVFGGHVYVVTEIQKADRVLNGLHKKISAAGVNEIYACFLSELAVMEGSLLSYIQLIFSSNHSIENAYGHSSVLKVSQVAKMVHREKHRMEAFVRFQLTKDGLFYAGIEPDFNVLPLILKHFKRRYADQKWLIYDLKRSYGIYYDLNTVVEISLEITQQLKPGFLNEQVFHEDELLYQRLWKDYFKSVNITERKNTKLHIQHVPKRYWKYLSEKFI